RREFMQENPGALAPAEPRENRMDRVLDMLEEKGYDVSAIRSALASGDVETARTLLREFLQENPGALGNKPGAAIGQARNGSVTGKPDYAGKGTGKVPGKVTPKQERNGSRSNGK
ncbi:MAG: hypothetical protein QFX32_08935, partial [Methanolinea sp.]|nr:hypothetical protein [Methanolinea sp.]